jgi:hypothetical protein
LTTGGVVDVTGAVTMMGLAGSAVVTRDTGLSAIALL